MRKSRNDLKPKQNKHPVKTYEWEPQSVQSPLLHAPVTNAGSAIFINTFLELQFLSLVQR